MKKTLSFITLFISSTLSIGAMDSATVNQQRKKQAKERSFEDIKGIFKGLQSSADICGISQAKLCRKILRHILVINKESIGEDGRTEGKNRLRTLLLAFNRLNTEHDDIPFIPTDIQLSIILSSQELFEYICFLSVHKHKSFVNTLHPLLIQGLAQKAYIRATTVFNTLFSEIEKEIPENIKHLFDLQEIDLLFKGKLAEHVKHLFLEEKNDSMSSQTLLGSQDS